MPPRRARPRGGPGDPRPFDPADPLPDEVPGPPGPGPGPLDPGPARPRGLVLVAAGREDRLRHLVDARVGEFGDPEALRARCGAAIGGVVPGLGSASADCPVCTVTTAHG